MLNKFRYILKRRFSRFVEGNDDIDMKQLEELGEKGAVILDVRSPQEYEEGHLNGAILIPEYELEDRAEKELINKENTIVVYCSSGIRSKRAQEILKQLGYINVYNLYNGLENYWDFYVCMLK